MALESSGHLLLDLPGGVLRAVLDCLNASDVVSIVCTCKQLRDVGSDDVVWEPRLQTWKYGSARWQADEKPWMVKYRSRKQVLYQTEPVFPLYPPQKAKCSWHH